MKKYINSFLLVVLTISSLLFGGCSKDKWNKHYDETAKQNDLVKGLRQKGYNEFASALEKLNLTNAMSSGMQFTIFAVPDQTFKQATANLSDIDLKFFVLNHMLAGKRYASSYRDTVYRALGGNVLYIWMSGDSLSNFYKESVKILHKDIEIPNAVIFELSKCITIYSNLYYQFSVNYPFFKNLYADYFIANPVQTEYPILLGVTSGGLTLDTLSQYKQFFTLTNTSNNLTFIVSKNDFVVPAYDQLVSKFLPYFIGEEDFIKNDIANNTLRKHAIVSAAYSKNADSLITTGLTGNKIKFPVSKVKDKVILDDGNKLFVIDTLLYTYPIRTVKNTSLTNAGFVSSTRGNFKSFVAGVINWSSVPQSGDYIEYTIPADSIYSRSYNLYLQYNYKSSYVKVKIYVDGDSLQSRWDLGSTAGAVKITSGSSTYYQYNIAGDFNIKKYSTHTLRLEVVGTKGPATEIMNPLQLILKLNE